MSRRKDACIPHTADRQELSHVVDVTEEGRGDIRIGDFSQRGSWVLGRSGGVFLSFQRVRGEGKRGNDDERNNGTADNRVSGWY